MSLYTYDPETAAEKKKYLAYRTGAQQPYFPCQGHQKILKVLNLNPKC